MESLAFALDREPTKEEVKLIQTTTMMLTSLIDAIIGIAAEVIMAGGIENWVATVGDLSKLDDSNEFREYFVDESNMKAFLICEHVVFGQFEYMRYSLENQLDIDLPSRVPYTAVEIELDPPTNGGQ